MDYKFTINYPNSYGLIPTDDPTKFVGTRERDGAIQDIGVQVIEAAPYIDDNIEIVDLKVITTILTSNQP